jgi:hypothetical protein
MVLGYAPSSTRRQVLLLTLLAMSICLYVQKNVFLASQLHRNDFKHLYIAAFLVGHGSDLYDAKWAFWAKDKIQIPGGLNPFVYPPFMAVLTKPLAWFSYDTAWYVWCGLNHVLLMLTLVLFCRLGPDTDLLAKLAAGAVLLTLFDPVFRTISAGQFNVVLLFAFTLSLVLLRRDCPVAAGVVIGIVASAKVAPGLFLIPLLMIERRAFLAMIASVCLCTGFAVAVSGLDQHLAYLRLMGQMSYGRSTWEDLGMTFHVEPANQAPSAVFYRLLTESPKTTPLFVSPAAAYILSVATAGVILGAALVATYCRRDNQSLCFALWFYPMLLIPSLCWDHYFTQLLLPIWILGSAWKTQSPWRIVVFTVGVAILSVPYPFESEWWKTGIAILGASLKFFAALGLYMLTLEQTIANAFERRYSQPLHLSGT